MRDKITRVPSGDLIAIPMDNINSSKPSLTIVCFKFLSGSFSTIFRYLSQIRPGVIVNTKYYLLYCLFLWLRLWLVAIDVIAAFFELWYSILRYKRSLCCFIWFRFCRKSLYNSPMRILDKVKSKRNEENEDDCKLLAMVILKGRMY